MKIKHIVILIIIFFLSLILVRFVLWPIGLLAMDGHLWGRETLGRAERFASELENSAIVFPVNKLVTGKHDLLISFETYEPNALQDLQAEINFEFTVQIRKGKSVKEKEFIKMFEQVNSRGIFYLFSVPGDFLWSKNTDIEITIKDFIFDEDFAHYFERLTFEVVHLQLLGHNINMVDGKRFYRNDGFRTW